MWWPLVCNSREINYFRFPIYSELVKTHAMPQLNSKVDDYIDQSQDFAKPILIHFRAWVHEACPECVEKIKWGMPHFDHKGMMVSMASFKAHCTVNFWKGALINDPYNVMEVGETSAMGQFGKIQSLDDLPKREIMMDLLNQAVDLNNRGVKLPSKPKTDKKEVVVPDYFEQLLSDHPKAQEVFENFSYSHRKEYVEWITEAKREATREKRMATAIEWISEGKGRNWKYEKC